MDKLTDFNDTSDVSDAAIKWVIDASGGRESVELTRDRATDDFYTVSRSRIIAARLIQQHRPDLVVDPVDAALDKFMQEACFESDHTRECARRLYLMGLEAGKKS